jgi:hypothetical protein
MVLQTSCRCLRQVDKNAPETALIYLNDTNAEKLNAQLQQQHHISLKEFSSANNGKTALNRYDRTARLKLPEVDFYQLKINYETLTVENAVPETAISQALCGARMDDGIIKTTDLSMETVSTTVDDAERGTEPATFTAWLYAIAKASFGTLTMAQLNEHSNALRTVFEAITYERRSSRYFSSKYNRAIVEANIRKVFCDTRTFATKEELIPESSSLLNISNFKPTIEVEKTDDYYPDQGMVEKIMLDDAGKLKVSKADQQMMELAEANGQTAILDILKKQNSSHPQKDRTFHYLPYHTDSGFEQTFLGEVLTFPELERLGMEIYYNGDRAMTEFKIKCYKRTEKGWQYVGMYTPDFLIIQRQDGKIHKAIIAETKGKIYANDPTFKDKRVFMETEFIHQNNAAFGYERFEYLYLEDSLPEDERIRMTHEKICEFFGGT